MDYTIAAQMRPDGVYTGTLDGPSELVGATFTLVSMAERKSEDPDEARLLDAIVAIGGQQLRITFAPGDAVIPAT